MINLGCYMVQFSVYAKVMQNETTYRSFIENLRKIIPATGEIRVIKLTEKQYGTMIFLSGAKNLHEKKVAGDKVVVF